MAAPDRAARERPARRRTVVVPDVLQGWGAPDVLRVGGVDASARRPITPDDPDIPDEPPPRRRRRARGRRPAARPARRPRRGRRAAARAAGVEPPEATSAASAAGRTPSRKGADTIAQGRFAGQGRWDHRAVLLAGHPRPADGLDDFTTEAPDGDVTAARSSASRATAGRGCRRRPVLLLISATMHWSAKAMRCSSGGDGASRSAIVDGTTCSASSPPTARRCVSLPRWRAARDAAARPRRDDAVASTAASS